MQLQLVFLPGDFLAPNMTVMYFIVHLFEIKMWRRSADCQTKKLFHIQGSDRGQRSAQRHRGLVTFIKDRPGQIGTELSAPYQNTVWWGHTGAIWSPFITQLYCRILRLAHLWGFHNRPYNCKVPLDPCMNGRLFIKCIALNEYNPSGVWDRPSLAVVNCTAIYFKHLKGGVVLVYAPGCTKQSFVCRITEGQKNCVALLCPLTQRIANFTYIWPL